MSGLVPLVWAFKVAPVKDGIEKLVLCALADSADEDGCNAYIGQATIARRAMISDRVVRDRLAELEKRGLIQRGDQRAAAQIPADKRPVVWDVMIPYTAFGDGIDSVNDFREGKKRPPITPANRPALPPAPEPKKRKDAGQKKPKKAAGEPEERPESETGRTSSPAGVEDRPESDADAAGVEVRSRPDLKSDNLPPSTFPTNRPPTEPADESTGGDQPTLIAVESTTSEASSTRTTGTKKAKEPSPHQEAARAIARRWYDWYVETYGQITRVGSGNPYLALEKGVVLPALESGWSVEEVQQALLRPATSDGIPDAVPDKQRFQRALAAVRTGAPAPGQRASNVHQMPVNHPDSQARAGAF